MDFVKGHEIVITGKDEYDVDYGHCCNCNRAFWRHSEDSNNLWVHGDGGWSPTPCDGLWDDNPSPAHDGPNVPDENPEEMKKFMDSCKLINSSKMKPSQLVQSLKRIASKIEASKNPKRELVIRDLKKILANIDEEMVSIFVEIVYPAGMTKEVALEKAREIVPCKTGNWELEDSGDGWMVGNLDCPESFYEENPDGFEASSDGVIVGFETP